MEQKIKDSRESQIRNALAEVFTLLGLAKNEVPFDDGQRALFNFITMHYPNILLSDIGESFSCAFKKTIEVDLSLYGRPFNAEYFARVMNAYLEYKRSLPSSQPPEPLQLEDKRTTLEVCNSALQITIETVKKLNKIPDILMINECFHALNKNNLIDLSQERIEQIRTIASDNVQFDIEELIRKGRTGEAKSARIIKKETVRLEMRKLFIKDYLKQFLSNA